LHFHTRTSQYGYVTSSRLCELTKAHNNSPRAIKIKNHPITVFIKVIAFVASGGKVNWLSMVSMIMKVGHVNVNQPIAKTTIASRHTVQIQIAPRFCRGCEGFFSKLLSNITEKMMDKARKLMPKE